MDNDGRPDHLWITTDGARFGLTTSSGATTSADIHLEGGGTRSVFVADVDQRGEVIALASNGRTAILWRVIDCDLVVEHNVQGKQYEFDLGFRGAGNGVGCTDVAGGRQLVGVKVIPLEDGATSIEQTVVRLLGDQARNGATATITHPSDTQLAAARQITCGAVSLADDGIRAQG